MINSIPKNIKLDGVTYLQWTAMHLSRDIDFRM